MTGIHNLLMAAAGASSAFAVDNSGLFVKADAEYLSADDGFGTPNNADVGTLAMWFKRASVGDANLRLFTHGSGASVQIQAYLTSANKLVVGNGTEVTTTQTFTSTSDWQHLVVRVDTSQGTAADRVRLYLNGSQITGFDAASYPSQHGNVFTSTGWRIASWSNSTTHIFDGRMAEVIYCDGQSLAPTAFAESSGGSWVPIDPSDTVNVSSTVEAIANVTSAVTSSGAASYAFSSVSLGTAADNRAVYVFASGQDPEGDNVAVSSLTVNVGGSDIAGARVSTVDSGAEAHYSSELWRVDVPTGTSGTVDVNWDQPTSQCGIIVWAVTGDHFQFDLKTDTTNSTSSVSFTDVPDNSVILAGKAGTGSSLTSTWSSAVDENVDQYISGTDVYHTGASKAHGTGGNFTVTCTPDSSGTDNRPRMFAMVLSPNQGVGNNGFYLDFSGTGASLGNNSAGSRTFTPAAANYEYNGTYTTIGSGTIDNNGAPGVSGRLNNPFSGDFTFSFTATAIAGSIFGCFDADELSTFATGTDDGGLDSMTKSWWYDDGGNGSGGAGSVGAGKVMYGNATQASSAIAAGSAVTITRTGSTIKITDDGSDLHSFSQTHAGPVYIMIGHRNITSKSMNFDSVSMTGSQAFVPVNSPTQSTDTPTS